MNLFTATTDETMRANIRASWDRASAECRRQGREWYPDIHNLVADLAHESGLTIDDVAAIVAVLSPRSAWGTNVRNTAAVLVETGYLNLDRAVDILRAHGYESPDMAERLAAGPRGLARSIRKARIIARGEYDLIGEVGFGQKTRSFWSNISDPKHSHDVTIDAWAAGVAIGQRLNNAEMSGLNAAQYRRVADAYRAVAKDLRMRAHVLQAATWCELRGRDR